MNENHNAHVLSSLHDYYVTRNINADDHVRLHNALWGIIRDVGEFKGLWYVIPLLHLRQTQATYSRISGRFVSKEEQRTEAALYLRR